MHGIPMYWIGCTGLTSHYIWILLVVETAQENKVLFSILHKCFSNATAQFIFQMTLSMATSVSRTLFSVYHPAFSHKQTTALLIHCYLREGVPFSPANSRSFLCSSLCLFPSLSTKFYFKIWFTLSLFFLNRYHNGCDYTFINVL